MVNDFTAILRGAEGLSAVGMALSGASRQLGFDHYALVWPDATGARDIFYLSDFPEALRCDGVVRLLAAQGDDAFAWADAPSIAADVRGYTVPLGGRGFCSFVTVRDQLPSTAGLAQARSLARLAFDTAQPLATFDAARLLAAPDGIKRPRLTRRQRDCVLLAARGKSDWVAAQLLGLSAETVHKYLEHAKRRYGVSSRTELVVRALHSGELRYADVL